MAVPKFIFLTICSLISISASQNITLNSPLFANDQSSSSSLVSPSGDFSFGFQKLNNTNLFLLATWFNKIPEKTIIWHANVDKPAQEGSKLELIATGLVLTYPDGQEIQVIKINQTGNVSYGAMLDTGNFVLFGSNSSDFLWESFKYPRDTILPSQILESDMFLFSRLTETNFSRGRFELYFSNGSLELSPIAWPTEFRYPYYFKTETTTNETGSAPQLVFNETSSDIYIIRNGEITNIAWQALNAGPSQDEYYYRATLDYNGVFAQYAYPKNSNDEQSWRIVKYIPEDICTAMFNELGSGSCGYNSYCVIAYGRPNCKCLPGYSLMDPNNLFGGCKPDFPVGCGINDTSENLEELYEMRKEQGVNLPLGDYERLEPYSEAECTTSCLQDCLCHVAIYGGRTCWKKRTPLANGRYTNGKTYALVKVRKGSYLDHPTSVYRNKKQDKLILIVSLSTSGVLNGLLLITVLILFLKFKRNSDTENPVLTFLESNLHTFSYKELQEATDNFKEQIGRGSSAIVYKGVLRFDSNNVVAVKKLDKLIQEAEKEFKTELKAIGKTCHKNLVRLLGFCEEGAHRLLVYEFMTNGTLANFLLGSPKPGWNTRAKIALEIARGLAYLHEECEVPIIHCDIKPENILLDENFSARISDFGLAKLLLSNQSRTLTNIRGTRGYVAPEWFRNVAVTAKVDVYSFGVMLLEIICCRKNVMKLEEEQGILTDWVCDCFMARRSDAVVESVEAVGDEDRVHRWLSIAIWCIQEDPSKRPPMKMILQMMEGCIQVPSPPPPCFFSTSS